MMTAALAYAARGWEIFPAELVGKNKKSYKAEKCSGTKWGKTKDPDEIKSDFKKWPKAGIGIPTGSGNGIWVLEADTKKGHGVDGLAALRELEAEHDPLPETLRAESPSGSLHHYFNRPDGVDIKNSTSEIAPGVDVRGEGGMVIAPPSIRADGAYRWVNEGTPIADAPPWLIELVRKRHDGKASPNEGEPAPDYLLNKGPIGISTDPRDLTPPVPLETIEAALDAIERNRYAGIDRKKWLGIGCGVLKELGEEKGFEVFHRWSKRGEDYNPKNFLEQWDSIVRANGYGWSIATLLHLANEADPDWRLKIPTDQKTEKTSEPKSPNSPTPKSPNQEPATTHQGPLLFDPWAPFIVPEFPFDTLPPVLQEFVASQSSVIGGDPSALAMAVLAACSGALDHRFSLKMMKHGNWVTHPRLWVLLVGPPSSRRTPLINAACAPLEAYQAALLREHQLAIKTYERAKESSGAKDLEKPAPPARYVVWDSTIEKLGELLGREPKGLLVKRDEFAGLIGSMEKYGHGRGSAVDRAFYLKAYDGGPFSIDRVVRGEMYVENLSLSIIGGIQPERLAELHGLTADGFLQRCLPIMMRLGELPQDLPTDDVVYERLIRELIEARRNDFFLTNDARAKLEELRAHLHSLERASAGLWAGFNTFVGKLHGIAGSVALILQIVTDPKSDFIRRHQRPDNREGSTHHRRFRNPPRLRVLQNK